MRACSLTLSLAALAGCSDPDELGSYRLARALEGARRLELVVPASLDTIRLEALAREPSLARRYEVEFERGGELDDSAARIVFADGSSPLIGAMAQLHGLVFEPGTGALWFQGRRYHGPREGLMLTVEDPRRAGWPLTAYVASDAAVAASLASELLPNWKPGFRTWRGGRIEREGVWTDHGGLVSGSASAALAQLDTWAEVTLVGPGCEVIAHGVIDPLAQARWVERLTTVHASTVALVGPPKERVRVHLWPDGESMAVATAAGTLGATCAGELDVHGVVAPDALDDRGAQFARALALSALGVPREAWLADALGAALADTWCGVVRLRDWREHLRARGLAVGFEQALQPVEEFASPHVREALRASLLRELIDLKRPELVLALWREGSGVELPWGSLRARWGAEPVAREMRSGRRERALAAPFLGGAHLVAPRDGDGRGWRSLGGRGAQAGLADMRVHGASVVVLDPVAYAQPRTTWWPLDARSRPFDASVCDEALISTARRARELGLGVVLAPQLLDAATSGLAAASMTLDAQASELFFERLTALTVHYALVAELCDADVLCVGGGLQQATDSLRDDIEQGWVPPDYLLRNTARWRTLLERVREAYGGALTYSAGDLAEAQQLDFWDELDFVGVELYRPLRTLSTVAAPLDDGECLERCRAHLRELRGFAASLGKPWIVTEFGLPPTTLASVDPAVGLGSYDVQETARLYVAFAAALAEARAASGGPSGVFLWCWTADPEHGNGVDRSFTLQNRPALEVLDSIFAAR